MSDLLEGIPYQPIDDDNEDKKRWAEKALPLVRKVFEDIKNGKIKSE